MGIVDIRSIGYYNVTKSIMFFDQRGNTRIPPPPYRAPKLHPVTTIRLVNLKK